MDGEFVMLLNWKVVVLKQMQSTKRSSCLFETNPSSCIFPWQSSEINNFETEQIDITKIFIQKCQPFV